MPKPPNYTDNEILLAMVWTMPKRMTKGQLGRLLGIKSAGQKHWRERLERLDEKKLISIEKLDTGEIFSDSPILKYYLTEENLEAVWKHYFINDNERNWMGIDPFLAPFSAGIWNVAASPGFCKLIGSRFNYHFLCAKNAAVPITPSESMGRISKEKVSTILDAVLSIGWETEAYTRKPMFLEAMNREQKAAYKSIISIYEGQIKAHPADYKKFTLLFDRSFKSYL